MSTITLQNRSYQSPVKRESILSKFKASLFANHASIICGILMANGSSNAYSLYHILSK